MTASKATDVLREWARAHRRKVSPCRMFDANVCSWWASPERPWELTPLSGEPLNLCVRFTRHEKKIKLFANSKYMVADIDAELPFEPLSINRPEKNQWASALVTEKSIGARLYPIFTGTGELSEEQERLMMSFSLSRLLGLLNLREEESVHVSRGGMNLYIMGVTAEGIDQFVDSAVELVREVEIGQTEPNIQAIPGSFQSLIPLMNKWGLASDDGDRSALIDDADVSELKALAAKVEPFYDSINAYLDSFGDNPLDDAAIALARLAEAAQEAKLRLETPKQGGETQRPVT